MAQISLDRLQYAGEFTIVTAKLHAQGNSKYIDLKNNSSISVLQIHEDIHQPCISGEMVIQTTHAYADQLPIIGQEKLELVLQTPDFEEKIDYGEIGKWFDVYSVKQRQHKGNLQTFIIKFISPESSTNARTTISESIQGPYSEIVSFIMNEHISTTKQVFVEASNGEKNMVVTTQHPFDVIGTATAHSLTEDKKLPAYSFFENFDGFHFKSASFLFNQPSIWKFSVNSEGLKQEGGGKTDLVKDLQSLTHMTFKQNDFLLDVEDGVVGSKLIVHDIFNKQYKTEEYSYFDNFDAESHVEEGTAKPIYNNDGLDYSKSRLYYQPVSIKKKGGLDYNGLFSSHKLFRPVEDFKTAQKNSQLSQLDQALQIECTVLGNTKLRAGNMVDISIPKASEDTMKIKKDDDIFHGKFLITAMAHKFEVANKNHVVVMTLVRDSLPKVVE